MQGNSSDTLDTEELTPQFINVLQQTYPHKRIEVFVREARDETEYLLEDPQLLKAVQDINDRKNMMSVSI